MMTDDLEKRLREIRNRTTKTDSESEELKEKIKKLEEKLADSTNHLKEQKNNKKPSYEEEKAKDSLLTVVALKYSQKEEKAQVLIFKLPEKRDPDIYGNTNAEGKYSIRLPPGNYRIAVNKTINSSIFVNGFSVTLFPGKDEYFEVEMKQFKMGGSLLDKIGDFLD